jgi:carboxyl-terminal processing protease
MIFPDFPPMSNPSRIITLGLIPVFALLLGWQLGIHAQQKEIRDLQSRLELLYSGSTQSGALVGDPEKEVDLSILWGVWRLLQNNYIEPADLKTNEMVYGAVRGLVNAVGDPYTAFMTPVENTGFRDALSGHLQGIGAELGEENNQVVVVSPLKGSPAEKAGLMPNDVIMEVNGVDMTGKTLNEVVTNVRGPKGTTVSMKVLREDADDLLSFTITRDDITIPSTEYAVNTSGSGSIGILTINQFGSETINEINQILKGVKPEELKGFVIDLRFNGGGYLDGAVDLVSMFLKEGTVVTVKGRNEETVHKVSGSPILPNIPLVVLQNQASASASEITAGALQDQKRATIIGTKSYGKGTVQEVVDLPGGSSLRVTIAKWLTPNGTDLGKVGITPDIFVDRTREHVDANIDPQMLTALEWLLDKEDISKRFGTGAVSQ